ncbi:MAG: hypothetical protein ACXVCV_12975 [Polyangia bacterium]
MMRVLAAVVALVIVAGVAHADPKAPKPILPPAPRADDSLAPARVDAALLDRSYKRAQNTRNTGIGLAAPGVALSILGGVLIGFGSTSINLFDQVDKIIAGVITSGAGLVIGIPGVYFWSTGQDDMDSVVWRRRQLLTSSPP